MDTATFQGAVHSVTFFSRLCLAKGSCSCTGLVSQTINLYDIYKTKYFLKVSYGLFLPGGMAQYSTIRDGKP